jgi:hypothetical protein
MLPDWQTYYSINILFIFFREKEDREGKLDLSADKFVM